MISITAPNEIRKVADLYKDVFFETPNNYNCICVLLCLHLFGMKSLSCPASEFGWSNLLLAFKVVFNSLQQIDL